MTNIVLPYKALSAENHQFTINVDGDFFAAFANPEIVDGELEVVVDAKKLAYGAKLSIKITGKVEVPCDRCLESCPIDIEYNGELTLREGELSEEYDEQTLWISVNDSDVDLSQYVYESVMLSLPYQRVHGEDENGNSLCDKEMLERFKIVSDEEFEKIVASATDKQNDPQWSKLNELKEKLNK